MRGTAVIPFAAGVGVGQMVFDLLLGTNPTADHNALVALSLFCVVGLVIDGVRYLVRRGAFAP